MDDFQKSISGPAQWMIENAPSLDALKAKSKRARKAITDAMVAKKYKICDFGDWRLTLVHPMGKKDKVTVWFMKKDSPIPPFEFPSATTPDSENWDS